MSSLLQYLDNKENNSVIPTVETKPIATELNTDENLSDYDKLAAKYTAKYLDTETPAEAQAPQVGTPKEPGFQKFLDQAFVQPASSFISGYFKGSAGITDTFNKYAEYITNLTGIEKPKVMEDLTKFYNARAEDWEKSGIPEGQGFVNDLGKALYEGAGIFGIDLPVIASMGQWGLPIYSAIKGGGETAKAHENIILTALSPATGIIKGGIEGTALHLTLGAFSNLSRPLAQIGSGATFAGLTAWEQALTQDEIDWSEVTAQGMLGVGLTLTQGKPSQLGQQFKKGKTNFVKYVKDKGISEKKAERFYDELKKNEVEIQPLVKEQVEKLASEGKLSEKQTEEFNLIKENLEITLKRIDDPARTETQKNQDINSAKQMENILQEMVPVFKTPEILKDKTEPVSEKKIERIVEKEVSGLREDLVSEPTFAPEVESRFQASKGVKKEGFLTKVKESLVGIKNRFTRQYEFLARNEENSIASFYLTKLSKQPNVSADKSIRLIDSIIEGLSPAEYNLFTRKVILDDLAATVKSTPKDEAIPKLPYGLKPETLNIELAKVNRALEQNQNVQDKINLRKENWESLKNEYIERMNEVDFNPESRLQRDDYFRHMVLEHAGSGVISGTGKRLKTPSGSKFLSKRRGSEKDINSDYVEAEFDVIKQMYYDMEVAKTIKVIDENYNIYEAVRSQAKAETGDASNWRDFVPENFTVWQPRDGNVFYLTESVPTKVANQLFEASMKDKGLTKKDLEQVSQTLAVGGKRKQYVIKEDLAKTLNNLSKDAPIKRLPEKLLSSWKRFQLISPRRYFKYNVRNLSGDAEGAFIGNPSTFKEVPTAIKELTQAYTGDKKMTPNVREFLEQGGMESTIFRQELNTLKTLDTFGSKYTQKNKKRDIPLNIIKAYWNKAQMSTDFREAILRYASYLDYKKQMLKNPDNMPDNLGASRADELRGLSKIEDKAFMLSNDLLGAYDRVSVTGQSIRKNMIPFWSFQEVNAVRFKRLIQNAANNNELASQVGKKVLGKAANPMTYVSIGSFIIKATALRSLMEAWNQTQFEEEENSLPERVKNTPHIITGVSESGKIEYIDRLGVTTDMLEWFGLDAAPQLVDDYLKGRKSEKEIALEMAKSPIKKIVNGINPFIKTPVELLLRKQLFPDPFDPMPMRDMGDYLARQLTLSDEYKAFFDIPSEGYATSLKKTIVSEADPQRAAYNDIISMKYEYLKKIGKPPGSSPQTPKSHALYNLKNAIRYRNPRQAAKYYIEYVSFGGTGESLDDSMKRLDPAKGIYNKGDSKEVKKYKADRFKLYLGEDNTAKLEVALKYYKESIVDVKQDFEFNKKLKKEVEKIVSQLK